MTSYRVLHLRHLSHRERQVLQLLRGGGAAEVEPGMASAFALLLRKARASDLTISAPTSPVVHQDEKKLLAWISLLQRRRSGIAEREALPEGALLHLLRQCAGQLEAAGCHLSYRAVLRDTAFERPLQRQVLRLVSERGTVAAHDLKALGASSHAIDSMRKTGLLRRIRHGFYALGQSDPGAVDRPAHA